mmetsp:Transcript_10747/g.23783  ORF Transcript_10747/g.23783 Transcript_10747/m.23783 type:complete len:341 (+) Transcript_10747:612-1634(+)
MPVPKGTRNHLDSSVCTSSSLEALLTKNRETTSQLTVDLSSFSVSVCRASRLESIMSYSRAMFPYMSAFSLSWLAFSWSTVAPLKLRRRTLSPEDLSTERLRSFFSSTFFSSSSFLMELDSLLKKPSLSSSACATLFRAFLRIVEILFHTSASKERLRLADFFFSFNRLDTLAFTEGCLVTLPLPRGETGPASICLYSDSGSSITSLTSDFLCGLWKAYLCTRRTCSISRFWCEKFVMFMLQRSCCRSWFSLFRRMTLPSTLRLTRKVSAYWERLISCSHCRQSMSSCIISCTMLLPPASKSTFMLAKSMNKSSAFFGSALMSIPLQMHGSEPSKRGGGF